MHTPFYDPEKTYEDNYQQGPFGAFAQNESNKNLASKRDGEPADKFLGHKIKLPFGIPAGPLINSRFVAAAFAYGFDINIYKTVRTRNYPCHPWPNVLGVNIDGDLTLEKAQGQLVAENSYREPLSITNSFGVPSMDPDIWQPDMAQAVNAAGPGQVMIGSFQGTKSSSGKVEDFIADYVLGAKLVKETGAPIMEANLSCPNEGSSDLLCFDTARVEQIVYQIKSEIGNTPLILKLAYFENHDHLRDYVERIDGMVEGFAVINTIPAAIVDQAGNQALPGEGRLRSGVCGAGIKWAGVEMVSRLAQLREANDLKFTIIGVGGVTQSTDYHQYRQAGADVVMSATGAMWNPYLAQEIWQSL